jgi:tRNA A-37 threonylcarbamoyl transferase component Bud32
MSESIENATLLACGATADVYDWGNGRVLKLFHERVPIHANEVSATRVAHQAGLPVPAVLSALIEVGEREGIIFERIEGPTMTEYLNDQLERGAASDVEACARRAAELHAQLHSTKGSDLPSLVEILHWSIQEAGSLDQESRQAVLNLLHSLPAGDALCHNDYYPRNLIVSQIGVQIIDWAIGSQGNPLADHARTWLISRMWLGDLKERAPDQVYRLWQRFWETYFGRYVELRPYRSSDLIPWQAITAAASLCWEGSRIATEPRVSLVHAALNGTEHPWLYRRNQNPALAPT